MIVQMVRYALIIGGSIFLAYSIVKNGKLLKRIKQRKKAMKGNTLYDTLLAQGYIPQRYRKQGERKIDQIAKLLVDRLAGTDSDELFSEEIACGFPKELEGKIAHLQKEEKK